MRLSCKSNIFSCGCLTSPATAARQQLSKRSEQLKSLHRCIAILDVSKKVYSLWYEQKEDVLRTYTSKMPERIPLEQEKEFRAIRNAVVQAALKIDPPPVPEQAAAAEQHIDTLETFDISAVRFAEETPESAPEESPPSGHSRPCVGFSNWWSDE